MDIEVIRRAGDTVNPATFRTRFASGGTGSQGDDVSVIALASATYTDVLTFVRPTAPGSPPVPLTVEGWRNVSGASNTLADAPRDANTSAAGDVRLRFNGVSEFDARRAVSVGPFLPPLPPLMVEETVPFTLTTSTRASTKLEIELRAVAQGAVAFATHTDAEAAFLAGADVRNTVGWGAISGVFDAGTGIPIADWQVTPDSGFDQSRVFPAPAPIPAAVWPMGSSLTGLRWLRERSAPPARRAG